MSVKKSGLFGLTWLLTWLFLALASGCREQRDVAKKSATNLHADIQSTAELRRRLVPGMPTNAILARFGDPVWVENLGEGTAEWRYGLTGFPADDDMQGTHVIGVTFTITNGHLARWACAYMGSPTRGSAKMLPIGKRNEEPQRDLSESPVLKVFIVSNEPVHDGRQIDTPQFPRLGFISRTPNLAIKRLKELTFGEGVVPQGSTKGVTNWQFGISLMPDDAAGLASLTSSHVGKKVLITIGDVPVIAPVILAPLEAGNFVIDCNERPVMETVRSNLTRMEQAQ